MRGILTACACAYAAGLVIAAGLVLAGLFGLV